MYNTSRAKTMSNSLPAVQPWRERAAQFPSVSLFSTETAAPIFTKILHNIAALVALLNHAYTRHYSISFLNARATKVQSLPFFSQNRLPWQCPLRYRKKRCRWTDGSSAPKTLSSNEKIAKIGPADPEIIVLWEIIKKRKKKKKRKKLTQAKYIAR